MEPNLEQNIKMIQYNTSELSEMVKFHPFDYSVMVLSRGLHAFLFSNDLQRNPAQTGFIEPGPPLQEPDRARPMLLLLPTPMPTAATEPSNGVAERSSSSSLGGDDTKRSFSFCLR